MRFPRGNIALRIFAVAFSILLWVLAPRPQGVETDRAYVAERPVVTSIDVRGLPEGVEVVRMQEWVTVHLRGLRADIPIDIDRVQVYVDMSGRGAGVHTVPVTIIPPFGVQVTEVDPPLVEVHVEAVATKELPVRVAALGLPSNASIEVLPTSPETVEVQGPTGRLQRVVEVIAPVRLRPGLGMQSGEVSVQAVDIGGAQVAGVMVVPDTVKVDILVTPEPVPQQALPEDGTSNEG